MDPTTAQVLALLFLMATVVLIVSARYFQGRADRRNAQRRIEGFAHLKAWSEQAIASNQPLHLAFGSAGIGEDDTAVTVAGAEIFRHIAERVSASDSPPLITTSAATTIPLGQAILAGAWHEGDSLARVQWYPQGTRSLAYAAALSGALPDEQPSAHILAGSFGAELALILDHAQRRGQGSLAVSDQLPGQAVAFAMADEVLIGEELFAAAPTLTDDSQSQSVAIVMDFWRALLLLTLPALVLLQVVQMQPWLQLPLLAVVAALLVVFGALTMRGRS